MAGFLRYLLLFSYFTISSSFASTGTVYNIILVNSFNESDFEVRMTYQLMNDIADDESIMVLTVPAYYADSVESLGEDIRKSTIENFNYQINALIQQKDDAKFERVVAIGRHASTFLDTNPELLPGVERYFLHIDWQPKFGTLIPSDYDPSSSYRQILAVFPDTKEILFVHGSKELALDQGLTSNFLTNAPKDVTVNYFNPMKHEQETLNSLLASKPDLPIIYINYKYFERNWESVHNWMLEQQSHPVFTIFAHNVNRYAGGAVVVPEKIADAALAIAKGESFSTTENRVVSLQFNSQQLDRWGINENSLPAGSEIVNVEPSNISLETVLVIVSFFMFIIIVMIVYMLYKTKLHSMNMAMALEQADSANKSKGEFLANMSHEIRTPMNGVLGTLQILQHTVEEPKSKLLIGKALYSANSLLTIINDILDYSKIEANKLSLETQPFSMLAVLDMVVSDVKNTAASKGILLTTLIDEGFQDDWVGDFVRVKQIALNLVSNAVKFTQEGGVQIKLSMVVSEANRHALCLEVEDTGIGMSRSVQDKIFERFTQADSSTTRKFGGTGLGMSITMSLVNLMNGQIEIQSELGKGTKIKVKLPLKRKALSIKPNQLKQFGAPDLVGKSIFIAEDNSINQEVIKSMLEPTKADLLIVENGQLAVDAAKNNHIDLVLMDIQMPVMGGVEACKLIKEAKPQLAVIALTADVMPNEIDNFLNQGFDEHVAKPVNLNHLFKTLSEYLQ